MFKVALPFLVVLLGLLGLSSTSMAVSASTEFKKFGKCTKTDEKLGCKTNIAGICDPYNPVNCIFQCHCPKSYMKKIEWIDWLVKATKK